MRGRSSGSRGSLPPHYTPGIVSVLKAAVGALRPREGGYERADDDRTVRTVLSFVPYMPRNVRWTWPVGLWIFDKAPILYGFGGRFRKLDEDARRAALLRLRNSSALLRPMIDGMRSLVMLSFYQQPEVLGLLEVDWETRARELIERRARLLAVAEAHADGESRALEE